MRVMKRDAGTVSVDTEGHRQAQTRVRRHIGPAPLLVCAALVAVSACSGKRAAPATPSVSTSSAPTGRVAATTPPFPPGVKVCNTVSSFTGWPTTAPPRPDAYTRILDAVAAGTPAQMSTISGSSNSGRRTQGGGVPTRRIVTLRVLGKHEVQVITDLSEDGGTVTTKTCAGLEPDGLGYHGVDC